jgi:outer membrane murein-binding lipoprotein Lpp
MSLTKEADSLTIIVECDFCMNKHEIELDRYANSPVIYWAEREASRLGWAFTDSARNKRLDVCPSCASKPFVFNKLYQFELPFSQEELRAACKEDLVLQCDNNPKTKETAMREELKSRVDKLEKQIQQMAEATKSTQEIVQRAEQRMAEAVSIMQAFVTRLNHRPFQPPTHPANPLPITLGAPDKMLWNGGPDPKPCAFGPWIDGGVCNLTHMGIEVDEESSERGGPSLRALWDDMAAHPENYPDMEACTPISEEEMRPDDSEADDEEDESEEPGYTGTHVAQYMRDPNDRNPCEDVVLPAPPDQIPLDSILPGLYINKDKRRCQDLVTVERHDRQYIIRETTGEVRSRVDQSQFEKRYRKVD